MIVDLHSLFNLAFNQITLPDFNWILKPIVGDAASSTLKHLAI
jgi:hypothetical protein